MELPREGVLWVVRDGRVLASCVQAYSFSERLLPHRIDKFESGAAILFGPFPVFPAGGHMQLQIVELDASLKLVKTFSISAPRVALPGLRTRVMLVAPEENLRRYGLQVGDQFEFKS